MALDVDHSQRILLEVNAFASDDSIEMNHCAVNNGYEACCTLIHLNVASRRGFPATWPNSLMMASSPEFRSWWADGTPVF